MDTILTFIKQPSSLTWAGFIAIISIAYNILSSFFGVTAKDIFMWLKEGWENNKEAKESLRFLKAHNYFIAHIIQVGGQFSTLYSLSVFRNEESGYYLNPPSKFVKISFNRAGDTLTITPSYFSKNAGFIITGVSKDQQNWKTETPFYVPLPIPEMKNEWYVKFEKAYDDEDYSILPFQRNGLLRNLFR